MVNSSQLSNPFGSYSSTLTVDEMPSLSHKLEYGSNLGNILAPTYAGYLTIVPGVVVSVQKKPHPRHLHNMRKTFGWTWEDAK